MNIAQTRRGIQVKDFVFECSLRVSVARCVHTMEISSHSMLSVVIGTLVLLHATRVHADRDLNIAQPDGNSELDVVQPDANSVLNESQADLNACAAGWFGPSCKYQCHCRFSTSCESNGDCFGIHGCQLEYFGPACQYKTASNYAGLPYLTDQDLLTCGQQTTNQLRVYVSQPIQFYWARIHVNNIRHLNSMEIVLNEDQPCHNEKRYFVTNVTVDVTCDTDELLTSLNIIGLIAGYICELYISEEYQFRLQNFTLEAFDDRGKLLFTYQDTSSIEANTYHVIIRTRSPLHKIMISGSRNLTDDHKVLTICEIQLYGETVCPERTYGIYCQEQCKCSNFRLCNSVTGLCAEGCEAGYYGFNCSSQCSEQCMNSICLPRTGICNKCLTGLHGDHCEKVCHDGTFGDQCVNNCSKHCRDTCDPMNGYCSCRGGYTGLYCTECPAGRFGAHCNESCPKNCRKQICNISTGECLSCGGSYIGRFCQDCPDMFYGENCQVSCSEYCFNGTCDRNGSCPSCTEGYSGDKCSIGPKKLDNYWYIAFVPLLLIAVVGCCFLVPRKSHSDDDEEMQSSSASSSWIQEIDNAKVKDIRE